LLAECVEIFEASDESRIAFLLLVNSLGNGGGEFKNALGEITDSFFPLLDVGSLVIKELVDDGNQGLGADNVVVENARAALIEDGALRGLKDDVVARVALVELALDFTGKVVFLVLRFPVTVREVIQVHESSVHDYRRTGTFYAIFGNEGQRRLALRPHFASRSWNALRTAPSWSM